MINSPCFEVQARPRCGFLYRCTHEYYGAYVKAQPIKSHLFNEMQFDLRVVRYSMLVDFLLHALVVIAHLPSRDASDA
jgi:hypothetical protein